MSIGDGEIAPDGSPRTSVADLLDDQTRGVLLVVDFAQRQGKALTVEELQDFALSPHRRVTPVFQAVAARKESVWDFVRRANIVSVDDGGVRLTRLGQMILRAADEKESLANQTGDIVLAAGDEWATTDVLRMVKQAGPCLLVDPYCREPQLNDLVRHTDTTRVLVGPTVESEAFDLTLGVVKSPRNLEIRVSANIHDRHVIPDVGQVLALGMSLNGLGSTKASIIVHLGDDISAAVRQIHEELWTSATNWSPSAGS